MTEANRSSDQQVGPHETAVCMGFDAMRICLGMQPVNFTLEQVQAWMRNVTVPSQQEIAASLKNGANGGTRCPVCARTHIHDHTPEELIIYRNGVKYGRGLAQVST